MPWDYSSPRAVRPGDRVRIELPYSEVCMHMRVAGKAMDVRMTGGRYPMAQLLNPDGTEFSAPILTSEAGIYGDVERGFYFYPEKEAKTTAEHGRTDMSDPLTQEPGEDPTFSPDLG